MGENSNIAWTDHTFNSWIGCSEVGPGCDSCYARDLDRRYQYGLAKPDADANRAAGIAPHWQSGNRHRTAASNWRRPIVWNEAARTAGKPAKVFAHSMSDVFDNQVPRVWREDLFELWRGTPWLRWIVLTKRVSNIARMLPKDWGNGYPNVGLMATVVTQAEFNRDAPRLLSIPARWHGFSMEPQIDRILVSGRVAQHRGSVWIITGGESRQTYGKPPRPYDPAWAAGLIKASQMAANIYVFVKQLGAAPVGQPAPVDGAGVDERVWPEWLRVREFPPELLT